MKIRFYTNSFFPDPIGISFYNSEWVEHLTTLGHDVEVLTALPYYPQWKIAEGYRGRWQVHERIGLARVTRCWVYVPERQTPLGRFLCELSFLMTSLPSLLRGRPDLVIAVSPPFGVGLAAALVRRLTGTPLWLHLQDLQVDAGEAVGFLRRGWLVTMLKALERWILKEADHVSTISMPMRDRVMAKGLTAVQLLPNWVDTRVMRPLPRENAFRTAHQLDGKFVILYAGSIGIHQGLEFLLAAAERLAGNPEILFVIAGDGNHRAALARRLARRPLSNLRLLPLQPKESLAEMLCAADVGIVMEMRQMANLSLPSKSLNQMACGRPLVAVTSRETALARLLVETGAGVVVPPGNAEQLAITLLELSHAPERLKQMGAAGRAYAERALDREKIWRAIPDHLAQALAGPPRPYAEYPFKRLLDIGLALAGFIISLPLWILIPLAVKAEDAGPVFFTQERVGQGGRRFQTYKFRSMHRMELPQFDRRQARRGDARITRVGAWLRRTAMDEVPQLINILKGDMSFVGPRALLPSEVEVQRAFQGEVPLEQVPGFVRRSRMRPGLTGIAQVFAARDIPRRTKFRYDALYLARQSLAVDIALILRSGWNSCTGRWEGMDQKSLDKTEHSLYPGHGDTPSHV